LGRYAVTASDRDRERAGASHGTIVAVCGRVTLTRANLDEVARELGADFDAEDAARYRPRYNGAPSDLLWLLVAGDGVRPRIVPATWGIPTKTRPAINIKAETLRMGAFRSRRRSLLIADGFYEWRGEKRARRALWFHRRSGLLLLGAIDTPLDASTRAPLGFSVITVPPGPDVAAIHDRQPAILEREQLGAWLAGDDDAKRLALLQPSPAGTLETRTVSERVNAVANDDPDCLAPVSESEHPGHQRPRQLSLLDDDR
jgi:putative SOS response-associated peptidase YedK